MGHHVSELERRGVAWTEEQSVSESAGRGAAWTEEQSVSEPEGRGVAWTEERGTSDEGRRRLQAPRRANGETGQPMPPRVVLGVGAGIAAYKACELLRRLTESGHQVRVVPTPDALRFVGAATWSAL